MQRIKKGDQVIVVAGKDKGPARRGAARGADGRVVVENLNVAKKHQRPNPQRGRRGRHRRARKAARRVERDVVQPGTTQKGDRVGFRRLRMAARCGSSRSTAKWWIPDMAARLQEFYQRRSCPRS